MSQGSKSVEKTYFRMILSAAMHEQGISQAKLAMKMNVSQPSISRVLSGKKDLDGEFAQRLVEVLGGSKEAWENVYTESRDGSEMPVGFFLTKLFRPASVNSSLGAAPRYLVDYEIAELFSQTEFSGDENICEIGEFDHLMVKPTSYDTRVGWRLSGPDWDDVSEKPAVAPGEAVQLRSLECFHMPDWLEAEIHPAASLGKNGLFIANGPIADPGYNGHLDVYAFNPTDDTVKIDAEAPFLTIRFRVLERMPQFINRRSDDPGNSQVRTSAS